VDITAIKTTPFPTIVIVMIKNKKHPIAILSAGITRYKTIITHRRALYMLLAAWGIAIFSSFVPIENGLHNPSLHTLENFLSK
jgi:hypothetical protein